MEIKSGIKFSGKVEIKVNGKLVLSELNLATNSGAELFIQRMFDNTENVINYFLVDDGAVNYTASTTALTNEILRKPITTKLVSTNKLILTTNITGSEALSTWSGIGLGNAASGGVITNLFEVVFLHSPGDVVEVKWTIEVNV